MDIKELRKRVGLKTADVASSVGVSDSSVRNWESGRTIPKLRVDQFALLCRLYKVSIEGLAQAVSQGGAKNG